MKKVYRKFSVESLFLFLSIIIMAFSLVDAFFDFSLHFQKFGLLIFSSLVVIVVIIVSLLLYPVLHTNYRGIRLISSIRHVGLYDIENRDDKRNSFPPQKFLMGAKRELFILAYTAKNTFRDFGDEITELIDRGVEVKVMLLYPNKNINSLLKKRESQNVPREILKTIEVIKSLKLHNRRGFEIRYLDYIPPYTAIMIDGDIEPIAIKPLDRNSELRVQPGSVYKTQHDGVIIHLFKTDHEPKGVFEFFVNDLRTIWKNGKKDRKILNEESQGYE